MTSPVILRLRHHGKLGDGAADALLSCRKRNRLVEPGQCLMRQAEEMNALFWIESGWAMRHRNLANGRRQILNLLLPGDICDLQGLIHTRADHSVTAMTPVMLCEVDAGRFLDLLHNDGQLAASLLWSVVQEEGILREHIVRIGRRSARIRLAHLLLELVRRQALGGGPSDGLIEIALTREVMADCLGLTPVHISRTLSELRRDGLVTLEPQGRLRIIDIDALARHADYDTRYLHLARPDHALDRAGGAQA
ncbi:MAG TPA: Crp/Fnr family transcriptional regulator [Oceanicaulis sp.]|jgi:CRP-like cAMP-binding protein|nr:Crp/Fnr family transcriptional regulator [Synechococcus moorigangaii CMS01]HCY56648.1 Crp/Fnr family transcriptional regulator [Oceanicaulis sp.]